MACSPISRYLLSLVRGCRSLFSVRTHLKWQGYWLQLRDNFNFSIGNQSLLHDLYVLGVLTTEVFSIRSQSPTPYTMSLDVIGVLTTEVFSIHKSVIGTLYCDSVYSGCPYYRGVLNYYSLLWWDSGEFNTIVIQIASYSLQFPLLCWVFCLLMWIRMAFNLSTLGPNNAWKCHHRSCMYSQFSLICHHQTF